MKKSHIARLMGQYRFGPVYRNTDGDIDKRGNGMPVNADGYSAVLDHLYSDGMQQGPAIAALKKGVADGFIWTPRGWVKMGEGKASLSTRLKTTHLVKVDGDMDAGAAKAQLLRGSTLNHQDLTALVEGELVEIYVPGDGFNMYQKQEAYEGSLVGAAD